MIRLSIIIPVFNVEAYIGECIESCLCQDIPSNEYEIILVDDCSSDKSIILAQEFYNSYQKDVKPDLRVIANGSSTPRGAAAARNTGLAEAHGEYIWFVDSDDKIEKNCLSLLINLIFEEELDILRFGYKLLFDDRHVEKHVGDETAVLDGIKLYEKYPQPVAVWSFIFKREFLLKNSLFFIEGYMFEDQDFSPKVHFFAKRAKMLSLPLYYYRQRCGSVMKSIVSPFKVQSALAVCESLYSFEQQHKDSTMSTLILRRIAFMFSNALNLNSQCDNPIPLTHFKKSVFYPLKDVKEWKYRLLNFSIFLSFLVFKIRNGLRK